MPKLTAAYVDRVVPREARIEIPDATLPGFWLVVQPSGVKSFQVRYRAGGQSKRMTLGRYPLLSLGEARERAREAMRASMAGHDPAAERAKAKEEAARNTGRVLFDLYEKRHLSKLKSGATVRRELERHAIARWADRDLRTITRRDVVDLLDEIADSGRLTTANRLRGYLGHFFGWCRHRDVLEVSPMAGVKPVAKEAARDRVLSDDEIRWFWGATGRIGTLGGLSRGSSF